MIPISPSEHLWREACRAATADDLADAIVAAFPGPPRIVGLALLTVDAADASVLLAGAAPRLLGHTAVDPRRPLEAAHLARLLRWHEGGEPSHFGDADLGAAALQGLQDLVPWRPHWGLPLAGGGSPAGLALVALAEGCSVEEAVDLLDLLREPLAAALRNHHQRTELQAMSRLAEADRESLLTRLGRREVTGDVVGVDGGLKSVMERVNMVAGADLPVLVLGETGSGKEVIARILHNRSRRAARPFIRVNCGAIPPELVDSELFGHEKGSFTGATGRRLGWFERAHGGTLLLDEIGELPRAAQVRLLRVLQDGILQRVGGETTVKVDVRIIAATHADLAAMVQAKEFREDLWYRLAVFPLLLPPLRERRQDIPGLVGMFVQRAAHSFGFRPRTPQPADLALLQEYSWPGNVRELGTVVDRAVLLGEGRSLEFTKALGIGTRIAPAARSGAGARAARAEDEIEPLDRAIARHLELALTATSGRVGGERGAAVLLGLNPNTLRSTLRRYGIQPRAFRR